MYALGVMLKPIAGGWIIALTDGRELARFTGPDAKREALRYPVSTDRVRRHPPIDQVRRVHEERGAKRPA